MPDIQDPALAAKLAPYRRTTWIPTVADGAGAPDGSRFGGGPWLRAGESWPACGNCGRPMQMFVQLDARGLPPEGARALEGGLLQMFYCTSSEPLCENDCEAWAPGARSTLVRLVPRDDVGGGAAAQPQPGMFPARQVTGWTERADYPNWEELSERGVELTDDENDVLSDAELPASGEKLLGWPHWVQGVEYPDCPTCGTRMEMLVQIDSEQNVPWMFGDMGVGHVTQCLNHRNQLAFGWACG